MSEGTAVEEVLAERPDLADPLAAVYDVDQRRDNWKFEDVPVESGPFGELVSRGVVVREGVGFAVANPAAVAAALEDVGVEPSGAGDERPGAGGESSSDGGESGAAAVLSGLPGPPVLTRLPGATALARIPGATALARLSSGSVGDVVPRDGEGTAAHSARQRVRDTLAARALDRTTMAVLSLAVAFVALVRVHSWPWVYRDGRVVLSGNDPYYYRYWTERAVEESAFALDVGALATLPEGIRTGEPLFVATMWWAAELLGGGATTVGHVLAWYPVVSAVVTAVLVYALATMVTGDRRVGLAAVLALAIVPAHAMRTSLGYPDHHAFDYPWLVTAALALVVLVRAAGGGGQSRTGSDGGGTDASSGSSSGPGSGLGPGRVPAAAPWAGADASAAGAALARLRERRVVAATVVLGVSLAAQVLAWNAGPLLIAPVGVVVAGVALVAVHEDRSPLPVGVPIVAGVVLGAALSALVHVAVGWQALEVALAPAFLLGGVVAALVGAEAIRRTTGDARHLLGLDVLAVVVGTLGLRYGLPDFWRRLLDEFGSLLIDESIAEAVGLVDDSFTVLVLLPGFVLLFALPVMAWSVWRIRQDAREVRWLVPAVYAWSFLVLALVQVRFVGELAPFLAVFAGAGFVWAAAWVDAVPRGEWDGGQLEPLAIPDRSTLLALLVLFGLLASVSTFMVPVKTAQLTISDESYHTVTYLEDHESGIDREFPENYVLSRWGRVRFYNYFVSGETGSFTYAQEVNVDFVTGTDPDGWYGEFDGRVGYIVLERLEDSMPPETAHERLRANYGSRTEAAAGVGHYRVIYESPGGNRVALAVVPGAVVNGTASPNATVTVETDVEIPNAQFTYERRTTADENGTFAVRVANPGSYDVVAGGQNGSVDVSDRDVRSGTRVPVEIG